MPKYQLIAGKHCQNGRTYNTGDVVESSADLPDVFRNKFRQVHIKTPVTPGAAFDDIAAVKNMLKPTDQPPREAAEFGDDAGAEDDVTAVKPVGGNPAGDGPSSPPNAAGVPKPGQQPVGGVATRRGAKAAPAAAAAAAAAAAVTAVTAEPPPGVEKTAKFPTAVDDDYRVFKNAGSWYVYNADDMSAPVNAKGVTQAEVAGVIAADLK